MINNRLSKSQQHHLIRILCSLVAFVVLFAVDKALGVQQTTEPFGWLLPFFLYLAIYVAIGYDVLFLAARNIAHGQIFDENFLMCVATLGAFAFGIAQGANGKIAEGFDEACAVLLFYQAGVFFERYATGKSRKSISELMDMRPDSASVLRDGQIFTVDPSEVNVGEVIVVNPGERVPLDGVCIRGCSSADTRALTGESVPREIEVGSVVLSGTVNLDSQIEIKVEKAFHDSTVSRILDLVESAADKKSKAENFITKFARYYTPTVVISAILLAILPGAITGNWQEWAYRALSFLVVSCPCALVISVPLSFFSGIGAAAQRGILVKGSDCIERLSRANIFVFDKTGTLTEGSFSLSNLSPSENANELLRLAAISEQGSSHPIAKCIAKEYEKRQSAEPKSANFDYTLTNFAGRGVSASRDGETILCGNEKLMREFAIEFTPTSGTAVYVAKDGKFIGSISVSDKPKSEAAAVIASLHASGAKTIMLTGDNLDTASKIATEVGVSGFEASLLPQDKVEKVEALISGKRKQDVLCFVGDGINDAPALVRADVGIAMGMVGSDAAIEAADVVLMRDDLRGLPLAKRIAKRTMHVVRENVLFSLSVKLAILILSALGIANMWIAVFGDVGVAVLAILNAMRVSRNKPE